jgi:hypothetical protein
MDIMQGNTYPSTRDTPLSDAQQPQIKRLLLDGKQRGQHPPEIPQRSKPSDGKHRSFPVIPQWHDQS